MNADPGDLTDAPSEPTPLPPEPSVQNVVAPPSAPPKPPTPRHVHAGRIAAVVAVVGITIGVFLLGDRAEALANYGYIGIFLLNILANATIVLPAPAIAVVFAMGAVFNPFWIGIAAGAGATIGEISGYLLGYSGQGVIENLELYQRIEAWTKKYGMWFIAVLAFIPNPLFDLAGMAAGVLKLSLRQFLLATLIGKILRMWLLAYAGQYSLTWVDRIF